jgi:hypothetical protein
MSLTVVDCGPERLLVPAPAPVPSVNNFFKM